MNISEAACCLNLAFLMRARPMDRALSRLSRLSSSCVRVLSSWAVSNRRMISLTIGSCSLVSQIFCFFPMPDAPDSACQFDVQAFDGL